MRNTIKHDLTPSQRETASNDGCGSPLGSRRGFVKAMAGGSLIAGFDAVAGTWVTSAQSTGSEELPMFDGTVMRDDASRDSYAQDYGQIVHERPLAVLRPGSVEDVAKMVRFARRRGLTIAARGRGHQPFGQAQVRDGIVIDMRSLQAVHSVANDRIEVDAGIDWRSVVRASVPNGQAPPVLPAYLGLTVGGTLSIGGIGVATFRHGAQVDHVLELQVVTGEGAVVTCSERRQPDLFEAALAGQGQCAIITRAALHLAAVKSKVRQYVLHYSDVRTLLEDEAALVQDDRFDGVVAMIVPTPDGWSFSLVASRQYTPPNAPDDVASTAGLRAIAGSIQTQDLDYAQYADAFPDMQSVQSHADLGLFVPASAAESFIRETLPRLRADDLGMAAGVRVFSWNRKPFSRPLFRIPAEDNLAYVATLRAETSEPSVVARMLSGNRTLYETNRKLGGTLYPYSALAMTRDDWRRNYGDAWKRLQIAKHRYDPGNVFASGPDLFR
jgi:cytokinin dehydrogenase